MKLINAKPIYSVIAFCMKLWQISCVLCSTACNKQTASVCLGPKAAGQKANPSDIATVVTVLFAVISVQTKTSAQQHIYTDSKERAAKAVISSPVTVQQQQQQQQQHQQQQSPQQSAQPIKEGKAGWRSRSLPTRASGRPYPPSGGDMLSFNWSPQLMGSAAAPSKG